MMESEELTVITTTTFSGFEENKNTIYCAFDDFQILLPTALPNFGSAILIIKIISDSIDIYNFLVYNIEKCNFY